MGAETRLWKLSLVVSVRMICFLHLVVVVLCQCQIGYQSQDYFDGSMYETFKSMDCGLLLIRSVWAIDERFLQLLMSIWVSAEKMVARRTCATSPPKYFSLVFTSQTPPEPSRTTPPHRTFTQLAYDPAHSRCSNRNSPPSDGLEFDT